MTIALEGNYSVLQKILFLNVGNASPSKHAARNSFEE